MIDVGLTSVYARVWQASVYSHRRFVCDSSMSRPQESHSQVATHSRDPPVAALVAPQEEEEQNMSTANASTLVVEVSALEVAPRVQLQARS